MHTLQDEFHEFEMIGFDLNVLLNDMQFYSVFFGEKESEIWSAETNSVSAVVLFIEMMYFVLDVINMYVVRIPFVCGL